ncbi:unnamed protein product [Symbiodinium natans]|uniref:Uncharacterized protein n=1 Tax=Symbiodinium natans TaxID=878477 RepID=A0A812JYW6_9DINO|nr:unnamed protein product [Symbiodinium natans]
MCRGLETDVDTGALTELPAQLKTAAVTDETMKGSDGSESPSFTFTPPPAEPSDVDLPAADGSVEVPDTAIHHLASAHDLEQGPGEWLNQKEDSMSLWRSRHLQCMESLVRQRCAAEEMEEKLREETARRIRAEEQVERLTVVAKALATGTRVPELEEQLVAQRTKNFLLMETTKRQEQELKEAAEVKEKYESLCRKHRILQAEFDSQYADLEKLHLERIAECTEIFNRVNRENQRRRQEEESRSSQETAAGSSQDEEDISTVPSETEEVNSSKDQDSSDSVPTPLSHLPEPVADPKLHTGVALLSSPYLPFGMNSGWLHAKTGC